jgi:hypothetical protein
MKDGPLTRLPEIKQRFSRQLTGPIPLGGNFTLVSFTEIVGCDWYSRDDQWTRSSLIIEKSGDYRFPPHSIRHIQVAAWPCSMSSHSEEDSGWAVDHCNALAVAYSDGDYMQVTLSIAISGIGTHFNRFGYAWTAYVIES